MYTQCPNCATAFVVTAEVLKQASGKVRCGGCENVFNSLLYLSEHNPGSEAQDASTAAAMSEEQAQELTKTLDDFDGPDVHLEDTGIEWLLLPDDESDIFGDTHTRVDAELSGDSGAARIDELLDDSPSPVDEFLTATPSRVDALEVFAAPEETVPDGEQELRFDDNSGLPEDRDSDADAASGQESFASTESGSDEQDAQDAVDADLAFGDPDEWGELLDESLFDENGDENTDEAGDNASADESFEADFESEPEALWNSGTFRLTQDDDIPELDVPKADDAAMTADDMIDRELMDVAIKDETGLASTIGLGTNRRREEYSWDTQDSRGGVETIIMEGDTVRTLLEQEAHDAEEKVESSLQDSGFLATAKQTFQGRLTAGDVPGRRTILFSLGGILLAALLAGQMLHRSRAELATIPAVSQFIDPVYRAIGLPVTPDWDVRGWRFEVTRGSTVTGISTSDAVARGPDGNGARAAGDEVLTIYSRVGNRASRPLPYPLIIVSLTNRFEETIGSAALEPREYLPGDVSEESLVPASGTFNAVVSIQSPTPDATGFKLNVCYRQASGLLRCATNAFR